MTAKSSTKPKVSADKEQRMNAVKDMDIEPSQLIGKEINEVQMTGKMCAIHFTDGSCLEITGVYAGMIYDYIKSE